MKKKMHCCDTDFICHFQNKSKCLNVAEPLDKGRVVKSRQWQASNEGWFTSSSLEIKCGPR